MEIIKNPYPSSSLYTSDTTYISHSPYSIYELVGSERAKSGCQSKSTKTNEHRNTITSLKKVLSSHTSIADACLETVITGEDDESNTLVSALSAFASNANVVSFKLDGIIYSLTHSLDENLTPVLVLKNKAEEVVAKIDNTSLEKARSRFLLMRLFNQLEPNARKLFSALFDIEKIECVGPNSPIVSGDLDGSTARSIVLSIQAGKIDTDAEGLALLADVVNAEARTLHAINELRGGCGGAGKNLKAIQAVIAALIDRGVKLPDALMHVNAGQGNDEYKLQKLSQWCLPLMWAEFQTDQTIQNKMEQLVNHLTFQIGHTRLISIGDGAHDRFSVNKDVDRVIREKLHEQGVIFITGNHDVFLKKEFDEIQEDERLNFLSSFGCFAKDTADATTWETHQNRVLSNVYYDQATRTLYLHHGLGFCESEDINKISIRSAFGMFSVSRDGSSFNPIKFANFVNCLPRPRPDGVFQAHELEARDQNDTNFHDFSGFRIDEAMMRTVSELLKIRIVHGHTGFKDTSSNKVIALNSRESVFAPMAVVAVQVGSPSLVDNFVGYQRKRQLLMEIIPAEGRKKPRNENTRIKDSITVTIQ